MTCPRCKCPECAKVELNAVLSRRVARETESPEEHNAAVLRMNRAKEQWRDIIADARSCTCHPDDNPPVPCPRKFALNDCRATAESARRFLLPREPGKPPVDPDAEQLSVQVGALADELATDLVLEHAGVGR